MFNQIEFKIKAKQQLKGNWKVAIITSAIYILIMSFLQYPYKNKILTTQINIYDSSFLIPFLCTLFIALLIWAVFQTAFSFIFIDVVKTSKSLSFKSFLEGLEFWEKSIKLVLWTTLWILLWGLLFILITTISSYSIGILFNLSKQNSDILIYVGTTVAYILLLIKIISYSQIFFIVAENPDISCKSALKLSISITKNYKKNIFSLFFSFIGWILLSIFSSGILFLWTIPYMYTSFINAYIFLKDTYIQNKTIKTNSSDIQKPIINTSGLIPPTTNNHEIEENTHE